MSTSKRTQSQHTAARLGKVLAHVGKDALQPAAPILAALWAQMILNAPRVAVLAGLKAVTNGSPGFDYGPVGLSLLRWIVINMISRTSDPLAVWTGAQTGEATIPVIVPDAPPSVPKASIPAAAPSVPPVALPQGPIFTPGASVPIAAPVAAPAPATVPFAEETVEQIVAEAVAVTPVFDADPPMADVCPAQKAHPEWDWQPASKVFGVKGLKGKVAVWPRKGAEGAHPESIPVDDDFVWDKAHLQWAIFCAGEYSAKGVWLWGNRGTGKTEFATQFAARTGRPFYKVTFTRVMEPSEFLGDTGASGGNSVWQDGRILQGLRQTVPAVIMLDEISYGQSSHISGPLNEIVHPQCCYTIPKTGEVVRFCKSHLFVAGDNTNGTGDTSGMYVGANQVNRATMDRFSYFRRFTYLPKALEVTLLKSRARCNEGIAEKVWGILDALRKKVDSGLLSDPPSIREAVAFASALRSGLFSDQDAYESSFVGKYAEESQEEMRVTFTAVFNATPENAA